MATHQSIKRRFLAVLVLLTFCVVWIPPPAQAQTTSPVAPITPIRLPHESVAHGSPKANADYVLFMQGSGITRFSMKFDSLDARQICVFWTAVPASAPPKVIAKAYAMSSHGGVIAQGWPVLAYSKQTLDFMVDERASWTSSQLGTGWRSTPVVARDGNFSCITTTGYVVNNGPHDNRWLSQAVRSTNYGLVRAGMEIGVKYVNQRLLLTTYLAQHLKVQYERRPSIAVVSYNLSAAFDQRFSLDVLQEPRVFRGSPYDFWTDPRGNENFSAAEQKLRWDTFMLGDTLNGGIAEGYAIALVTQNGKATSGVVALVEAAAKSESIVRLRVPSDIALLSPTTDPATKAEISEALAAPGAYVIATRAPTTATSGWRGTPWIAWYRTNYGAATHVGTYLGVLRGGAGQAGSNPSGMSHADADASATTLGTVAAALGIAGGFIANGPFGPVGKAIGVGVATVGVALGLVAASLKVSIANTPTSPKTGHVDIDEGPAGPSVASGPGAGDAGGPAGSAPGGPGTGDDSESGVGVNGNGNSPTGGISGSGGDTGTGFGDPGED